MATLLFIFAVGGSRRLGPLVGGDEVVLAGLREVGESDEKIGDGRLTSAAQCGFMS